MSFQICKNCKFFNSNQNLCQKYPPIMLQEGLVGGAGITKPYDDSSQRWPQILYPNTDTCNEFFPNLSPLVINIGSLGDNIVIPGVAGETVVIYRLILMVPILNASVQLTIKDGSNIIGGPFLLGSLMLDLNEVIPWFSTSSGNNLVFNLSSAIQVTGSIYYAQG